MEMTSAGVTYEDGTSIVGALVPMQSDWRTAVHTPSEERAIFQPFSLKERINIYSKPTSCCSQFNLSSPLAIFGHFS
ncbi:unnamed protein product [Haemonchus placei]|uniref:Uncharacterized protein n=1 Tax=Haemonchus placei TaxID=6290 RepID=A0A3P7XRG5_HAEPC|nr:unnamed protein product [Haemonchus placei]